MYGYRWWQSFLLGWDIRTIVSGGWMAHVDSTGVSYPVSRAQLDENEVWMSIQNASTFAQDKSLFAVGDNSKRLPACLSGSCVCSRYARRVLSTVVVVDNMIVLSVRWKRNVSARG